MVGEKIISNPEEFEDKKRKFKEVGAEKIHVVSDFDRTITHGLDVEGKRNKKLKIKYFARQGSIGLSIFIKEKNVKDVFANAAKLPGLKSIGINGFNEGGPELIQNAKDKGKVARIIASYLMKSVRIDYFSRRDDSEKLKKELEKDIKAIKWDWLIL